jgi:protein-S-isoprenylcysteine O-methyltransferase Ste14
MGKRGEGWVLLQMVLFVVILLAPRVPDLAFPQWLQVLGLLLLALGGVLGTWGILSLGKNLTAFPRPLEGGTLVTRGPYGFVRHPIYSGLILGTLGWAVFRENLIGVCLALVLFVFFDLKSRQEERWLSEAYSGYKEYQQRVRKLIPWVY